MMQLDLETITDHIEDNRTRVRRQISFTTLAEKSLQEEYDYLKSIGDKQSFSYLISKAVVFYCQERKKKREKR